MVTNQNSPKMEYAYEVYAGPKSMDASVLVYRGFTLDEVCGFALGLFRSSNVPDFRVVIFSIVTNSDLVTFVKE